MKRRKRRALSLVLAAAMFMTLLLAFSPASGAANVILIGDADGSGSVTKDDVEVLSRYVAGWDGYADKVDMDAADVSRDGKVTKADATILARYMAGWDGYDTYINTLFIKNPLTIVKEPVDVEMNAQSAVLSITVSGEFDSVVYDWQKKTASGWRDAPTLNSEDATYTVNNSALQIISKNGTEGFGEYRCVVSAFYKGSLVSQVISRTATVDPQPAPLKAVLGDHPRFITDENYYYYYHTSSNTKHYTDPETGEWIKDETNARIMKNYSTEERFQYMITPQQLFLDEEAYLESGIRFLYSKEGFFDVRNTTDETRSVHQDENGDWWGIPAAVRNCIQCSIGSVSGGKGPYTYTWYLSKDRFGNDFQPLIEGYNCYGQGTEEIVVWPFLPGKGKDEPYFMGFLCCRVTDSKGRTANATYWLSGTTYFWGDDHESIPQQMHCYVMLYVLDENNHWFDSPNIDNMWWWAATKNIGTGGWW